MHFSLQNKPRNILKNPLVILILLILVVIGLVFVYGYAGIAGVYTILFLVACVIIAVSIKSFQKRAFQEFDTTDQGIAVHGKTYSWTDMKYYSWYGEKQGDRIGAVGLGGKLEYDPVNPYKWGKTQIAEVHLGWGRRINLQIDAAQVGNLTAVFTQYGVRHISLLRKIVGF